MDQRKRGRNGRGKSSSSTMTSRRLFWVLLATTWTGLAAGAQKQQQQRLERLGGPDDGWPDVSDGSVVFSSWSTLLTLSSESSESSQPSFPLQHFYPRSTDDDGLRPRPRGDRARCSDACQMVVGVPTFADVAAGSSRLQRACGSRLQQTSLYLCLRVFCGGYHGAAGLVRLNQTCATYAGRALPPYDALVAAFSDDDVARLRRLRMHDVESLLPPANLSQVVVPTEALHQNGYDTLVRFFFFFFSSSLLPPLPTDRRPGRLDLCPQTPPLLQVCLFSTPTSL